jgi:hypothetical protein
MQNTATIGVRDAPRSFGVLLLLLLFLLLLLLQLLVFLLLLSRAGALA